MTQNMTNLTERDELTTKFSFVYWRESGKINKIIQKARILNMYFDVLLYTSNIHRQFENDNRNGAT